MGDAQDAARRLRERRHADQTRRRLTRIFDADGDGLSDSTLPMFGQRSGGRQGPPPSPISLPVGECVALEATGSIPDGGGYIEWDTILESLRGGFTSLTAPVSQIACPFSGITQVTVELVWTGVDHDSAWKGDGAVVRFDRNTEPLWPVFAPATGLPVARLGTDSAKLPFSSGQQLGVWVQQDSGSAQPFTARLSWGMEDPQRLVVTDPVDSVVLPDDYNYVGSSFSAAVPSGTAEGDRLYGIAANRGAGALPSHTITASGWTVIGTFTDTNTRMTLATKIAGASEPAFTYSASSNLSSSNIAAVVRVPGGSGPVDVAGRIVHSPDFTQLDLTPDAGAGGWMVGYSHRNVGAGLPTSFPLPEGAVVFGDEDDPGGSRRFRLARVESTDDLYRFTQPSSTASGRWFVAVVTLPSP